MNKIIVELNDAQYKALSYVAYDPEEWVQNFVNVRCAQAIKQIFDHEAERISSEGGTLSGTKEDIVLASNLPTAKQRTDSVGEPPPVPSANLL